ncbi:MAG: glycosyltransferase family 4 protein [Bacteroidales bacterium]|nr:glycosyltransferase family 4 protein [Bacteroidales bacterium]
MNKSKGNILLLTIGNKTHPSSRIRALQFIPSFQEIGFKVTWIPRVPIKNTFLSTFLFPLSKRLLFLKMIWHVCFKDYSVIFIQKIFIPKWLLKFAKGRKIKLIYDFDDAVYINSKDLKAKKKTILHIINADFVVVASPILQEFAENYKTNIIQAPSAVNTKVIHPKISQTTKEDFIVGWIGSFWTTKYIAILENVLKKLSKKYTISLLMIGADQNYKPDGLNFKHYNWELEKEGFYLQQFDVGVMPLTIDQYSEGKGGYKLIQYMASGIPSIASPVGINNQIIDHGQNGFLAETDDDWFKYLEMLISNKELSTSMGKKAREKCEKYYSIEYSFSKISQALI